MKAIATYIERAGGLPVGAVATAVGAATLSNVYSAIGHGGVRYVTMVLVGFVWLCAIIKLTLHHDKFREEYKNVVPASLYATVGMLTMILGSFIFDFNETIGRVIWTAGVIGHFVHILVFTYRNVIKKFDILTFVPSWFVTYLGLLVSTVVGVGIGPEWLLNSIVTYGFIIYGVLFPAMVIRVIKKPICAPFKLTVGVFLAPTSLLLVSYLNVFEPISTVVFVLYGILFVSVIYVFAKLVGFLQMGFNPGFAGYTFPVAIALVATMRFSAFLVENGYDTLGQLFFHKFSVKIYITTAIISFVAYNFIKMLKAPTAN